MNRLKRNRSMNWSQQEKRTLRKLVLERANIIEAKDTTTNTNTAKKNAWNEVLLCFNTINVERDRDLAQLQNQWRNMKNRAKKLKSMHRSARKMTGGGSPPPSPPAEDQEPESPETKVSHIWDEPDPLKPGSEKNPASLEPESPETKFCHIWDDPSPSTPCSEKPASLGPQPSQAKYSKSMQEKTQKKKYKSQCCDQHHEHELFVLAKTAREEEMKREKVMQECKMMYEREARKREKEMHERRMMIMSLEEEYWREKIKEFKQ